MTPEVVDQYHQAIEALRQEGTTPAVVEHLEQQLRLASGPFALSHLAGFGVALEGPQSTRHPDVEFRPTWKPYVPHTWLVGRPGALQPVTCRHDGIVILLALLAGSPYWPGTTEQATQINHRTLPQIKRHWPDLAKRLKVTSKEGFITFKQPPLLTLRVVGSAGSADVGLA